MVDLSSVDTLLRNYATPLVGAALILAGIFLRLLGRGLSYLILGAGILGTLYVGLRELGTNNATWVVGVVFLGGFTASVTLALALRAATFAITFGFFTVGWYLLLQAVPAFLSGFPALSSLPGSSTWIGSSILTSFGARTLMRRLRITRVPAMIAGASGFR